MKAVFFRTRASHLVALWLLGALICVLRNPLVFAHPIAGWEDGTQGINIYAQAGAPLFHLYAGYVQAWPNLIYRAVMFGVPLPFVPYALSLTALAITALVVPASYSFIHDALGTGQAAAFVCAAAIGIVPAGDWVMMSNVDYSIWPVAAVLILFLWAPVPPRIAGQCFYVAWRALAVATNPLALPVTLVWAVLAIRAARRGERWVYGLLTLAALAYAVFGVEHKPGLFALVLPAAAQAIRLAVQSGLLALLPGANLLGAWPPLWLLTGILAAMLAAIAAIRRRPAEIAVFGLGLGAICMIAALGRGVQYAPAYLITTNRFAYVPRLLWCCLIAAALADLWRRHPGPPSRLGIAAACTLLITFQTAGLAGAYAWNDLPTSDGLLAFLADTRLRIEAGQPGPFTLARKDPYGDWSIVIPGSSNTRP